MIMDLVEAWIAVLKRPSVQTFDERKPFATNERTLTGVILAAVVSAVLSAVLAAIIASFVSTVSTIGGISTPIAIGPTAFLSTLVRTFIQTILGFYLFCYILQYVATKFFGGRGVFEQQAYLISTYWVPLSIITQVLVFVPCIGWLIALLLVIYGLVLTTFAVQSAQGISVGNAVLSWIIAGIGTGIVLAILGVITGGWL